MASTRSAEQERRRSDLLARTPEALIAAATDLADSHQRLRHELVRARRESGLSQSDVAELLDISQPTVAAFERYDNDPRLSTIRRYALAVGAQLEHRVCTDWSTPDWVRASKSVGVVMTTQGAILAFRAPSDSKRTDFALGA
jgi:DNA-binding XRE family transcriptional regulator